MKNTFIILFILACIMGCREVNIAKNKKKNTPQYQTHHSKLKN